MQLKQREREAAPAHQPRFRVFWVHACAPDMSLMQVCLHDSAIAIEIVTVWTCPCPIQPLSISCNPYGDPNERYDHSFHMQPSKLVETAIAELAGQAIPNVKLDLVKNDRLLLMWQPLGLAQESLSKSLPIHTWTHQLVSQAWQQACV